MPRVVAVLVGAVAATAVVPATAGAATVEVVEDGSRATLQFTAGSGEANAVTATLASQDPDGNRYTVRDTGATVTPGTGCTGGGSPGTTATCLVPRSRLGTFPSDFGLTVLLSFTLGDAGDTFDSTDVPATDGGSGDFRLEVATGDAADTLLTGPGIDRIDPGTGSDNVNASGGDDFVEAGAAADGPDQYDLGAGADILSYGLRTESVTIDLKDPTHAGAAGENDSLAGVDTVSGGMAGDRLMGTDERSGGLLGIEALWGGGGADLLVGRGGPDSLVAGALPQANPPLPVPEGNSILIGGPGRDGLSAFGGDDHARGGRGADSLQLGAGDDHGLGGPGRDSIMGEDGADELNGGRGRDRLDAALFVIADADEDVDTLNCGPPKRKEKAVSVEPHDRVRNCEKVRPIG